MEEEARSERVQSRFESGERYDNKLLSWASDIEQATIDQAARTARLPFVEGHVALMPDAHKGLGSTVGSVVPTRGAVIRRVWGSTSAAAWSSPRPR